MGVIPETFRRQQGVVRSCHPQTSFAAWGARADYIVQDHKLDHQMDDRSPLGRIYELDGAILLLGVGHDNNTSMHLAEYRANYTTKKSVVEYAPVLENGVRTWKGFEDIAFSSDDFADIGKDYERENAFLSGSVGQSEAKLFPQRQVVDHAVRWMERNRN
jgi:aminoglycoside 3-N-acetyltransferase